MNEYEKQAHDFLAKTGAKIEARYIKTAPHFVGDQEPRDIYEIKMTRGTREYIFTFGSSIQDTENRIASLMGNSNKYLAPQIRKDLKSVLGGVSSYEISIGGNFKRKLTSWEEEAKQWKKAGVGSRPNEYSILACLSAYEPPENVDDFALEYGYEKPSVALKVFEAVQNEYKNLKTLFNDEELQDLGEIA